jgi:hypothetical protein
VHWKNIASSQNSTFRNNKIGVVSTMSYEHIQQFPHCDSYILHAPGECEYCDMRPEWQELRQSWGIAFTGQPTPTRGPGDLSRSGPVLPCPADFTRPPGSPSDHRRWGGNTATGVRGDPSQPWQTSASIMMYGDQGARGQWPLLERVRNRLYKYPMENLRKRRQGYKREGMFWVKRHH